MDKSSTSNFLEKPTQERRTISSPTHQSQKESKTLRPCLLSRLALFSVTVQGYDIVMLAYFRTYQNRGVKKVLKEKENNV